MRGDLFEVIGFMRRAMTVEGVNYEWSEYLLFNPYKGFRWLSEYNGHWNFLKTTTHIPKTKKGLGRPTAQYLDKTFVHFQTYKARVVLCRGRILLESASRGNLQGYGLYFSSLDPEPGADRSRRNLDNRGIH